LGVLKWSWTKLGYGLYMRAPVNTSYSIAMHEIKNRDAQVSDTGTVLTDSTAEIFSRAHATHVGTLCTRKS
jgi:hypothetical protein